MFFKGVLIKDPKNILVQQTKNVQSGRQIRFTNIREVIDLQSTLKAYIKEAIEIEKAGLKVEMKKTTEFEMPEEFKIKLDKIPALKIAFYNLTQEDKEGTYFIFLRPNKQKRARQELKSISRRL